VRPALRFAWLWASSLTAACAGPTLDLGESLRDASQGDRADGDGGDAGTHDAGTHDAGCRDDDDCTSASLAHCAVDSGLCVACTQNDDCASGFCEIKANSAFNHCEEREE
jgi:hypothetical protein